MSRHIFIYKRQWEGDPLRDQSSTDMVGHIKLYIEMKATGSIAQIQEYEVLTS